MFGKVLVVFQEYLVVFQELFVVFADMDHRINAIRFIIYLQMCRKLDAPEIDLMEILYSSFSNLQRTLTLCNRLH